MHDETMTAPRSHRALGDTLYYRGEMLSARAHLEQAMVLYRPQQYRLHLFRYAADPSSSSL
jgi:hypothetical protein